VNEAAIALVPPLQRRRKVELVAKIVTPLPNQLIEVFVISLDYGAGPGVALPHVEITEDAAMKRLALMVCALGLAWITSAHAETDGSPMPEKRYVEGVTGLTPELDSKFRPIVRHLHSEIILNNKAMPTRPDGTYINPRHNIVPGSKVYNPITIPLW
jgi:hypothetical protein